MSHPGDVHVANQMNEMRKYMETKISTSKNVMRMRYIPRAKDCNEGTEEARSSSRRLGKQEYLRRKRPGQSRRQVWINS